MATIEVFAQPFTLYRYRSLKALDREIGALESTSIYCGDYSKLNDPMEGFFDISRLVKASATSKKIEAAIKSESADVGISSFSETQDNELMWAHYANQFTGICIAYNFPRLRRELPTDVYFSRMHYTEKIPIVGITRKKPDALAKRVLSYKNHRWLYEREWRMFGPKGLVKYKSHSCIRRVYLGFRIEPATLSVVQRRLSKIGVSTKLMKLAGYSIDF